ncbi:MAG: hypothetical protein LQ352_006529 [Teloschistes flavicans]|nr:MAG: hypothetical protein LQ352_006529 [Teloschistes flavicans]
MDAKPQRPARSIRVYGDENAAPGIVPQKNMLHRNKSSPALSTMAQGGGLKAAAKRTAFADLTNNLNAARPSKDDSAIPIKAYANVMEKPVSILPQDKKLSGLSRPAQRPLSVSGLKSLLHNVSNALPQTSVKQPLAEIQETGQPAIQQANVKKLAKKKSAAVFKENVAKRPDELKADTNEPLPPTAPLQVHHDLPTTQSSQRDTLPEEISVKEQLAPVAESSSENIYSEEAASFRSDGIYIDNNGDVQQYVFREDGEDAKGEARPPLEEMIAPPQSVPAELTKELDEYLDSQNEQDQADVGVKPKLVPVSEPEEYWEEEDANYEEEGYVTARSFKSRGDNTTNGVTTVVFPKVNQKVKKELAAAKELIESTRTAEEIDDETWDTSMVAEYGEEIFGYMRDLEIKMLPNAHYMDNQAEIQWSMRSVLMDWLVQVHHRFGLLPETLFLCVNYIDRFLSCKIVSLGKLQLVGATAIFVAAKYEEINCPSVQEIVFMVDGGYTVDEILKAERFMLSMLQFELGWPGPMSFLRRISKADDYDLETRTLAKYFLEITIMDERFVGSPPSFVAAGAHCLARMMLKKGNWSPAHTYYSNYTYTQLYNLVLLMVDCCEDPRKHHGAIFDKYTDKRYKRASLFAETEMRKGFQVANLECNSPGSRPMACEDTQLWRVKT